MHLRDWSLKLEIKESPEFLEKQLKQFRTATQKERIQMLWWLKSGQVKQHQELAHSLGRDPSTIRRGWLLELLYSARVYVWIVLQLMVKTSLASPGFIPLSSIASITFRRRS